MNTEPNTVDIRTSELSGVALDWAVTSIEQPEALWYGLDDWREQRLDSLGGDYLFCWSSNWGQAGPIIERDQIAVLPPIVRRISKESHAFPVNYWRAMIQADENEPAIHGKGPTPLISAMRCYVASKLGGIVSVPRELVS